MALSAKEIQALTDTVAMWRMQEYILIPWYCFYVYYFLTTMAEEVSVIRPQRWNRGKALYMTIRYAMLVYIVIQLTREYRNYIAIPPKSCKALLIGYDLAIGLVALTCSFSLALCLSALVQLKAIYLVAIIVIDCAKPAMSWIINVTADFQYPAKPTSPLLDELGYPCYYISQKEWSENTIGHAGQDVRAYLSLAATTIMFLLGIAAFFVRYKGQGSPLIQVLRRDGGLYYMSMLAYRMLMAIFLTPQVVSISGRDANMAYILLLGAGLALNPILAQRLLINMRKVDYIGSQPVASKLLFAPPPPGSDDDLEDDPGFFEMAPGPSGAHHQGAVGKTSSTHEAREHGNNA
ncbi:hypothetical protein FA13DRAFT_98796 [Coprinellus micaceus]|uniref:Uncharacterized protein n=1 Tax=Coprinellus micaceus TaxID=71717 RepID=A0A4Y7SHZ4_COPMI|nr:hypothetical protein FA13DRAFT_98796 [Coprinellus micaceus]